MRVKKRVKRGVKKGIKSVKSAPPEAYLASVGVLVGGAAVLLLATTKSGRELLSRTAHLALRPEADEQESQESGGTVVGGLTREVGGRLFDAGKTAATSVVASRIGTLSESLAERNQNMRMGAPGGQAGKSRADEAEEQKGEEPEQPTDESEEQEASRDEEPEEPVARSPRRRRSASPAGRRTPSPAATSSSRPRPAAKKSSSSESSPSRPRPAAKKSSSSASSPSRPRSDAKKSSSSESSPSRPRPAAKKSSSSASSRRGTTAKKS